MSDDTIVWRKAHASGGQGGNCLEVGTDGRTPVVHVRDTKSRERGMITVDAASWRAFLDEIRDGQHALLAEPERPPQQLLRGFAL
jgi:Domain of unknown function (DUF397)